LPQGQVERLQHQFRAQMSLHCPAHDFAAESVERRSGHRYHTIRHDQAVLRRRIREIAAARIRYGYFRIYIVLRREGLKINHKRVYRLYR
jgi:hypothetical protein